MITIQKIKVMLMIVLVATLTLAGCISDDSEPKEESPVNLQVEECYTTYNQVQKWYTIANNEIHADSPRTDRENPNDYQRNKDTDYSKFEPEQTEFVIAIGISNPSETVIKNIKASAEIPKNWQLTEVRIGIDKTFDWATSGDFGTCGEGWNYVYIEMKTDWSPLFIGYDSDRNGFADIYDSNELRNFDKVDCEEKNFPIIWSNGTRAGNYNVKLTISGENVPDKVLNFKIKLQDGGDYSD